MQVYVLVRATGMGVSVQELGALLKFERLEIDGAAGVECWTLFVRWVVRTTYAQLWPNWASTTPMSPATMLPSGGRTFHAF